MNPVVQAQLKAFSNSNPSSKFSESDFFEVFSIYSISNGLLTDDVDPFKAHLQGDEFGLDGITIKVQGELCTNSDDVAEALTVGKNHHVEFGLFQSKTSEKADYGNMSKFFDAAFEFFSGCVLNPSDQLQDRIAAKEALYASALKRNPSLDLFYVTTGTGEMSDQIKKLVDATTSRFVDLSIFDSVRIKLIGAKDLQTGYRSATNSNSERVEILKPITLPEHPNVQQAFLGYVDAKELVKLATVMSGDDENPRINRAVFFDNVRDFNDKSEINHGILEDLKSGGRQSFIFKNNGVTVVAKSVNRQGDFFDLEDYQIVNGCQTSNILFQAQEHAKGVHVPFRLIVSDDPEFVSTVIIGTNRQNEVKEDQFWALTPFMKDLEEFCREQSDDQRIFIERRENQYRTEAVERTRVFKPSELVKSVAAMFMYQPHRAARDYRGIKKEFSNVLFQSKHSVKLYHAAAFTSYKLDFAIRNRRVDRAWGIYKFYVLYMIGRQYAGEGKVFDQKRKMQDQIASEIISFAEDEDRLVNEFSKCAEVLDRLISEAKLETREKIRDHIRSESVSKEFTKSLDLN
ncbi:MAG: AIPR family protein [Pseudomonadota bacterium]